MYASVIIPTKNRPEKIVSSITSILQNRVGNFEIIIVDQSHNLQTQSSIKHINNSKLKYFHFQKGGKACALNYGISLTKGNIICFTDDDCIVDKDWLKQIIASFTQNTYVMGVFGRVLPFQSTKTRKDGLICPCTFNKTKSRLITYPTYHADTIGYGNNMAYKKELFQTIGLFKTWLGPGSIGSNAEDAEFVLRTLLSGYQIHYNPNVIVWHNKWLKLHEYKWLTLSYACGETACYGYYLFSNIAFAYPIICTSFRSIWSDLKKIFNFNNFRFNNLLFEFFFITLIFFAKINGLLVALYYSQVDRLTRTTLMQDSHNI